MRTDVLIVGQGISGTMLSWFLHKEDKSFIVVDKGNNNTSSNIAAGIINPVTGRRYVTTWMIETLVSFAKTVYAELGDLCQQPLVYHRNIIDFFPSAQMRNAFVERMEADDTYLRAYPEQNSFNNHFNYDFGCGEICPCYMVDMNCLISSWRKRLSEEGRLLEEDFDYAALQVDTDEVRYNDISAGKIIFCDGTGSMQNPMFSALPFSANKGEVLIIECSDLPADFIFKKGMVLAPLPEKNYYWVGSSYQWEFENDKPSEEFYRRTKLLLEHWLKFPFKIADHRAALRPATLERRPFVGFHPVYPSVGILNGMGTKGASLAPFFANQLVQNLFNNFPLTDEANISRFSRILSGKSNRNEQS
jgi:glycine/D-amino acid oxidase-like deaminating enzyme